MGNLASIEGCADGLCSADTTVLQEKQRNTCTEGRSKMRGSLPINVIPALQISQFGRCKPCLPSLNVIASFP